MEDREELSRNLDEIYAERKNEQRLADQVQELKMQVQAQAYAIELLHTAINQADTALRQAGLVGLIAWEVDDGKCKGCWLGCEECVARQDKAFTDAAARETLAQTEWDPDWDPERLLHEEQAQNVRIREKARRVILRQDKTFKKLAEEPEK